MRLGIFSANLKLENELYRVSENNPHERNHDRCDYWSAAGFCRNLKYTNQIKFVFSF